MCFEILYFARGVLLKSLQSEALREACLRVFPEQPWARRAAFGGNYGEKMVSHISAWNMTTRISSSYVGQRIRGAFKMMRIEVSPCTDCTSIMQAGLSTH